MRCLLWIGVVISFCTGAANAQGVLGDVLSGKLVKPAVGQWAWYDLTDMQSGQKYIFRQAIVGEEQVESKKGYWLETEIAPLVGHPSVYKMLVTGPTNDPGNIHRILLRQGRQPVTEIPVESQRRGESDAPKPKQESLGEEELETPGGTIMTKHVILTTDDGIVEMWLNDAVRPMGIVRMRAPHGELMLRSYGEGGDNALSRLHALPGSKRKVPGFEIGPKVEVEIMGVPDEPKEAQSDLPEEDD